MVVIEDDVGGLVKWSDLLMLVWNGREDLVFACVVGHGGPSWGHLSKSATMMRVIFRHCLLILMEKFNIVKDCV